MKKYCLRGEGKRGKEKRGEERRGGRGEERGREQTVLPGWSYFSASEPKELGPDKVGLCLHSPCARGEG